MANSGLSCPAVRGLQSSQSPRVLPPVNSRADRPKRARDGLQRACSGHSTGAPIHPQATLKPKPRAPIRVGRHGPRVRLFDHCCRPHKQKKRRRRPVYPVASQPRSVVRFVPRPQIMGTQAPKRKVLARFRDPHGRQSGAGGSEILSRPQGEARFLPPAVECHRSISIPIEITKEPTMW